MDAARQSLDDIIPWKKSRTAIDGLEHMARVRRAMDIRRPSVMRLYGRYAGKTAIIVGGGVSIERTIEKCFARPDAVIFAVNASYDYCIREHGLYPHFGVICDVGEHTAEYIPNPDDSSEFILSSQVCEATFSRLPKARTYVFHAEAHPASFSIMPDQSGIEQVGSDSPVERMLKDSYQGRDWTLLYPGSTTPQALIILLDLMGFHRVELMGVDGSMTDGRVHPYPKSRLDIQRVINGVVLTDPVTGEESPSFDTTLPLARQTMEWRLLMWRWCSLIEIGATKIKKIVAHGDGMIPWMMKQRGLHVDCEAA